MKLIPGTLQAGGALFASTHWSLVVEAGDASGQAAEHALADLCRTYWPPVYTFVRRRGYPTSDAQDLTQAFFLYVLEKRVYVRADPSRGRFRSFLLAALKHFLADAHARVQTSKRGGSHVFLPLSEEMLVAESAAFSAQETLGGAATLGREDRLFEERWAAALVGRALASLHDAYVAEEKRTLFHALRPFLGGGTDPVPDQEDLAVRLSLPVNTLRTHIHRLRERYRAALRAEVAHTVANANEVREELCHLMRVLIDGQ